jgi:hypothetical protein
MRRANLQVAQWAVFSMAYSDALKNLIGCKAVNSLHLEETPFVVSRTKSMGARLRDVGKLKFKQKPEQFSDI